MSIKVKLVKETLGNEYNYNRYLNFIVNLFKHPNLFTKRRDEKIWKEYVSSILAYYKVAEYEDKNGSEILILAVELKKGSTVERARSLQRNFISKILDGSRYSAAIVAFYTEGEENWRLSFVKLDYKFTDKGPKLELTPAKRFSYLVGKNEPTHTASKRLLKILKDDSKSPTLEEIEEVFSIQKVTDDFFQQYKEKYLELKEYLENSKDFILETKELGLRVESFSEQFSKKLMGQIAFLYFLQKKGWLGVTLLPKNRVLSIEEYNELATKAKDKEFKVLSNIFLLDNEKKYYEMDIEKFKRLSEKEIDKLSDCFKNTKFDMPWGTGEKKFIRGLFNFCELNTNLNFFNDYLEPFFYEALNKSRKNNYYRRFNCKIPFLNGGLFEPIEGYHWRDVKFHIPNEIFSNKKEKGINADGILDIFDMYNFTINESEPLEKEVAVDPEMLGKVFENLLDVNSRKSKGAFYTPREIVHYMCQETLTNYIANKVDIPYEDVKQFILYGELMKDEDNAIEKEKSKKYVIPDSIYENLLEVDSALDEVRIADPSVGSGAFPLGMLTEIVNAKENITEYIIKKDKEGFFGKAYGEKFIRSWRSSYKIKWNTIKNCIYAVDIEPSAVDITKLRLWLSLVVDQELKEGEDPHPLPNLDMNIHIGNSLIDEYEGIELFDESILKREERYIETEDNEQLKLFFDSDEILEDMFLKQNQFFEEYDEYRRKLLKEEIDYLRDQLIIQKLRESSDLKGIKKYKKVKNDRSKPFFIWELEFAKVFKENGGFDIVIGNPPYVGEKGNREIFDNISKTKFGEKYHVGRMDLFYYFYHKGIDIGNKNMEISFITTNYFKTADSAYKLRKDLKERVNIRKVIDFNEFKIFESALGQHNIILFATKSKIDYVKTSYIGMNIENKNILEELLLGQYESFINNKFDIKNLYDGDKDYIRLEGVNLSDETDSINSILNKISVNKIKLGSICNINQGIVSGCDSLSRRNIKKLDNTEGLELKDGIFILDTMNDRDLLKIKSFNEKERLILKDFFKNSDIKRYFSSIDNDKYILYTNDIQNINVYPNIKKHMDNFKPILLDRREVKKGTRDYYDLQWPREKNIFTGEKIVAPQRSYLNTFAYNNVDWFASADVYFITKKDMNYDLKYILALLNSKTYYLWLYYRGKRKGNMLELYKTPLEEVPIPKVTLKQQKIFIKLVNDLYSEINYNGYKNNKVMKKIQEKIEDEIYKIYNFSEKEKKILEEHFNIANKDYINN